VEPDAGGGTIGRPVRRVPAVAIACLGAAIAGFLVGREVAYQSSVGGESGIFGAAAIVFAALLGTVLVSGAWLVIGATRVGLRRAVGFPLPTLGVLLAAAIVGDVTAAPTGGTFHRPVQLLSEGATTSVIRLDGGTSAVEAAGTASCRSVPDATAVGSLDARDLGKVEGATLRGSIGLATATDPLSIDLFVDAVDFAPDEAIPSWSGTGTLVHSGADALDGRVEFDLRLTPFDPKMPAPTRTWPQRLSGTIDWTCDPLAAAQADQ
jgi:hypothetical protein